jgi:hypothetical protein
MANDDFLDSQIQGQLKQYLNSVLIDLQRMWYDTVTELVYEAYSPKVYQRTDQLRDKFKVEIKDNTIYAYVDSDNMEYKSITGKSIPGDYVAHFVSVGHDTVAPFEGDYDMFNHYPPRRIFEIYYNRVKENYPELQIELVQDELPII